MIDRDRTFTWYLAQLKPNCALVAQNNLKRQGFETFLPVREETRGKNGKFVTRMAPLFPGYIFVAFNAAKGLWRKINSTYGVSRLVGFGPGPTEVPAEIMQQLMARCDEHGRLLPSGRLQPGDRVTLATGPLASFAAEIEAIAPDQRVWVLLDIMGGQTRVTVGADQLRPI